MVPSSTMTTNEAIGVPCYSAGGARAARDARIRASSIARSTRRNSSSLSSAARWVRLWEILASVRSRAMSTPSVLSSGAGHIHPYRAAPRVPRCGCDPNHLAANHVRTCRRAPFASDRSRFAGNSEPPGPTCGTSAPGISQARRTHRRDLLTATAASPRRAFGLTMRSSPVHAVSPDAFARHRARGYALT